ncbi:Acetyltransferase (GNAT) family protein [Psychrobacter pasteurii]|uniref:Acetyltransferase (GNAT) family protein n=1 Tax=Psychrobacter pasteurii TaxID=1945520 RepID=A0A1R4EJ61_9GAMM|nr:GNAT family N-acetyltransferase [Psychrobacter pasteurii]SJM38503.1 Acetyltransferase (GNAT) family protein [Psychrobacter pasteurii]
MLDISTINKTKPSKLGINPLVNDHYQSWLTLWQKYLSFYNTSLADSITTNTWQNLLNNNVPIYGFGAWQGDTLVGIVHVVLHPNTWDTTDCCYLEDLFVNNTVRGQGVGRALIERVYQFADSKNCNRVYWVTDKDNTTARHLYDSIANLTDVIQYRHNL